MARNAQADDHPVSPLARMLRDKQAAGMSFREMERHALQHGQRLTSSSFEQIAKDSRARRLGVDAIRAIAVVLGLSPTRVAELDDARWGLTRIREDRRGPGVEAAILDDSTLSERRKRQLIELYQELQSGERG